MGETWDREVHSNGLELLTNKLAIIAYHERKAGEMQISRQTSNECAIITHHEWKAGESLTMSEKPEKYQFRPFLWQKDNSHLWSQTKNSS